MNINHQTLRTYFIVLVIFLTSGLPMKSLGALYEDLGVSPKAMSLGNAVTADPPGIYSIHFNPAGLTSVEGTQGQASLASPWFKHEVTFDAPNNFSVFGFTDDPVKNRKSTTTRAAIVLPFTTDMISANQGAPAPTAGGLSYNPPDSPFSFATGIYPQFAGGLDRDAPGDPARFAGRRAAGQRITFFSPTVGYEYSDNLSFGLSIGMSHVGVAAKTDMRAPNPIVGLARTIEEDICPALEGFGAVGLWIFGAGCGQGGIGPFESAGTIEMSLEDSVVPHYNLGMQWEPASWFGLGVTYRSEATARLAGNYKIDYSQDFQDLITRLNRGPIFQAVFRALQLPPRGSDVQSGRVNLDLTFPQHVAVGTKFKPTSNLQLNVDWKWTDFDKWDSLTARFDRPNDLLRFGRLLTGQELENLELPRGYKSNSYMGYGLKYDIAEFHQLRLGYEDRKSSIPPDKIGPFGPLPDANLYGAGWGYKWSRNLYIDFSLSHIRAATTVPAGGSTNVNSTGIGNIIYNPYAGLNVGFETTATIAAATLNYKF